MAKRQTKKKVEPEYENGFDAMGQVIGAEKGELNPDAVAQIDTSNDAGGLEPLIDVSETETAPPEPSKESLLNQILDEVQNDPQAKERLVNLMASSPNAAKVLGVQPGQAPPSGDYNRNYHAEPALRVYGGVEVAHEPGWEPHPPSWLPMWQSKDGGKTSLQEQAAVDVDGNNIKTEEYKLWLDHHMAGTKMDSNIRFDIGADEVMQADPGAV
jgi:hypothetical protein